GKVRVFDGQRVRAGTCRTHGSLQQCLKGHRPKSDSALVEEPASRMNVERRTFRQIIRTGKLHHNVLQHFRVVIVSSTAGLRRSDCESRYWKTAAWCPCSARRRPITPG